MALPALFSVVAAPEPPVSVAAAIVPPVWVIAPLAVSDNSVLPVTDPAVCEMPPPMDGSVPATNVTLGALIVPDSVIPKLLCNAIEAPSVTVPVTDSAPVFVSEKPVVVVKSASVVIEACGSVAELALPVSVVAVTVPPEPSVTAPFDASDKVVAVTSLFSAIPPGADSVTAVPTTGELNVKAPARVVSPRVLPLVNAPSTVSAPAFVICSAPTVVSGPRSVRLAAVRLRLFALPNRLAAVTVPPVCVTSPVARVKLVPAVNEPPVNWTVPGTFRATAPAAPMVPPLWVNAAEPIVNPAVDVTDPALTTAVPPLPNVTPAPDSVPVDVSVEPDSASAPAAFTVLLAVNAFVLVTDSPPVVVTNPVNVAAALPAPKVSIAPDTARELVCPTRSPTVSIAPAPLVTALVLCNCSVVAWPVRSIASPALPILTALVTVGPPMINVDVLIVFKNA